MTQIRAIQQRTSRTATNRTETPHAVALNTIQTMH